jgi:hypothetical protein
MPLRIARGTVHLEGHCTVEEALDLQAFLVRTRSPRIVLTRCAGLHTALLQVLAAARPGTVAPPADATLARAIVPFLRSAGAGP